MFESKSRAYPRDGRLLALLTNITLGWKGLSRTSILAYWGPFVSYEEIKNIALGLT
jgi:hypothetical protein